MAPVTFNPRFLDPSGAPRPANTVNVAQLGAAPAPDAIRQLIETKLPPKAAPVPAPTGPEGWLYLDNGSAAAKDYQGLLPEIVVPGEGMAGIEMRSPDQVKLDKLDRVRQMPLTFKSVEEARAWKPVLQGELGTSWQRTRDGQPPFAGIDGLSASEQAKILADPRRAYAGQLGLLDGSMPALPPPFPADARPNAAVYLTDPGQQAIIMSRVPKQQVTAGEGSVTVEVPNEPVLGALRTMYEMPTRFASIEEAKTWHPAQKSVREGGDPLQVAIYNNSVASAHPWEHIDQLPAEVQQQIIADPRLTFAGLKGLIPQQAPAGFKPMRSEPTPSGRVVSFEENMGGYNPSVAPEVKWVPGSGLMVPQDATFVPHQYKQDVFDRIDEYLPVVAQIGAGAIAGAGLGAVGGAAFEAAGAALTTDGNPLQAGLLSLAGSALGGVLQPVTNGISNALVETVGYTAANAIGHAVTGAATSAVLGGDPLLGAAGGALGSLIPPFGAETVAADDGAPVNGSGPLDGNPTPEGAGPPDIEIGVDPEAEGFMRTGDDMTYMDGDSRRRYDPGNSPLPSFQVVPPDSARSFNKVTDAETSLWAADQRLEQALDALRIPRAAAATSPEDVAILKQLWADANAPARKAWNSYQAAFQQAAEALESASTAVEQQRASASLKRAEVGIAISKQLLDEILQRPHFTRI